VPKIRYEKWQPRGESAQMVVRAEQIATEYDRQGYDLTLRQLYYQFVARGWLANTEANYNKLGRNVEKGRMAGFIDWDHIVDRTRTFESLTHWNSPEEIIDAVSRSFRMDKWEDQPTRIEVWVEKEALAGVIEQPANQQDCGWFSCRGYSSASAMWGAAQRIGRYIAAGQNVIILHLGDHDPSGIDMTRDIEDRLSNFVLQDWVRANLGRYRAIHTEGRLTNKLVVDDMVDHCGGRGWLEVRRIALNMDQVDEYGPPPNPAKVTDSRFEKYQEVYGDESWELDALDPGVLDALITGEIEAVVDEDTWAERLAEEARRRTLLQQASDRWSDVVEFLEQAS
jgi:hypothetical protein